MVLHHSGCSPLVDYITCYLLTQQDGKRKKKLFTNLVKVVQIGNHGKHVWWSAIVTKLNF